MRGSSLKGLYHLALVVVSVTSFNWAFLQLTQINLVNRVFSGVDIPLNILAITICVSAGIVLWHNWID